MNETNIQQNMGKPNDEIDIFEFCARMWNAFKNFLADIKNFFVSIIIFLIRKSLWIASFAIAGIVLGFLFYGFSKTSYSSWMEGNTGDLDNSIVIDHVNRLNQVAGKSALLADFLNITKEQAEQVGSIKAFYGIDVNKDDKPDFIDFNETFNPNDTNQLRAPSFIYIRVTVYDEDILPTLRNGLIHYINSSTYLQDLFNISRLQKEQMIRNLQHEIEKIDSLQRSQFRRRDNFDNRQTFSLSNTPLLQTFQHEMRFLYEEIQTLERELELSNEIIVIVHDFMPLSEEVFTILKSVFISGGVMALLGIFFALAWQHRKRIWELIREE